MYILKRAYKLSVYLSVYNKIVSCRPTCESLSVLAAVVTSPHPKLRPPFPISLLTYFVAYSRNRKLLCQIVDNCKQKEFY